MIFSSQAFVEHPPQEVWKFIADFETNGAKWLTGEVSDVRKVSTGKLGVGTVFRFNARGKDRRSIITAFEPETSLTLTSKQAGTTAAYTYSVEPQKGGCVVKLSANCTLNGVKKILTPLVAFLMQRTDSSHPQRIKAAVEAL